jgi:hypothetical protein
VSKAPLAPEAYDTEGLLLTLQGAVYAAQLRERVSKSLQRSVVRDSGYGKWKSETGASGSCDDKA